MNNRIEKIMNREKHSMGSKNTGVSHSPDRRLKLSRLGGNTNPQETAGIEARISRFFANQSKTKALVLALTTLLIVSFIFNIIQYKSWLDMRDKFLIHMYVEHDTPFLE